MAYAHVNVLEASEGCSALAKAQPSAERRYLAGADVPPWLMGPTTCVACSLASSDPVFTVVNPGPPDYVADAKRGAYLNKVGDNGKLRHLRMHGPR